ncbi:hypothetical protein [Nonomuraea dietziae]|uniref:hypothetical protein n=1 Tax=Nonomuraea dietziae TaxID=65515 RepID=UPI0031D35E45
MRTLRAITTHLLCLALATVACKGVSQRLRRRDQVPSPANEGANASVHGCTCATPTGRRAPGQQAPPAELPLYAVLLRPRPRPDRFSERIHSSRAARTS